MHYLCRNLHNFFLLYGDWLNELEEELFAEPIDGDTCKYESVKLAEVNALLTNYGCIGCHNNTFASSNVNLEGFENLKISVENNALLGSIKHEPNFDNMPQGGSKLPDCDIKLIETWIAEGYPNN